MILPVFFWLYYLKLLVFSELLFFAMQNITIFNAQFWFRYENAKFIAHSTFEDEKNPNFFVHYRDNLLRKPSTLSELHRIFVKIKYYSFSYSCCWSSTWINNLMMEFKFVIQPHFENDKCYSHTSLRIDFECTWTSLST